METLVVSLHVFVCIFLVGLVLLQVGKGADVGAVFGGASQTIFGGRGPATFLNKLTIIVSVLFLITSVWLAKMGTGKGGESVIDNVPVKAAPATPAVAPTPTEKKTGK